MKRFKAESVDRYQLQGELSKVKSYIETLIAKYGPNAQLEFSAVDDYGGYTVEAEVSRIETDEEYAKREASENEMKIKQRSHRYNDYLKLKQEFEPK